MKMSAILVFPMFLLAFSVVAENSADQNALIKRGTYLAELSDCYACHTTADGEQYGGGLAFPTPFGTVYSTNVSSDKEEGIGDYSYQDFYNALHAGTTATGNLYPAMPYTSYHLILEEDMKALYAYFMSTNPSSQKNKENDMDFPFNIRSGMKIWNFAFTDSNEYVVNKDKSEQWNRGNYIINGFGHCGECHTPRNDMFAMEQDKHFQGAMIGNSWASDITTNKLVSQGWSSDDLKNLLRYGYSEKGTITGDMYIIVYHSLSKFNDEDLEAAVVYLLDSDVPVAGKPATYNPPDKTSEGYQIYMSYCSSCHGYKGQGIANYAPALTGIDTLTQNNIHNVLMRVLYGIPTQYYSPIHAFYNMPSFDQSLDDQELTYLINYLRSTFTTDNKKLNLKEISQLRAKLEKQVNK